LGNDKITGGAGADKIQGGEGMDTVDGGKGKDKLEGGKGADLFMYDTEDTFKDFNSQEGDSITGMCSSFNEGIPNLNKLASENNSQF
jgi:Ca2+-binding RTX toxin-like protein